MSIVFENHFQLKSKITPKVAKGCYTKRSDIDLLVLIDDNKSLKELRNLRHLLEDEVETLMLNRKVDIKIYNKCRYEELIISPCFGNPIVNDLINLRNIKAYVEI